MSASSNVVALLAEQNSEASKSGKCLAEQENKTDESEKSLNLVSPNCAADEAARRKKRLDNIGCILETLDKEHCLKSNKCEEQDEAIGAISLLTGEDIGYETFGKKRGEMGWKGWRERSAGARGKETEK